MMAPSPSSGMAPPYLASLYSMELFDVSLLETTKPGLQRRLSSGTASTGTDSSSSSSSNKARVVSFHTSPTVHSYERDYLLEDKAAHWYGKAEIQAMVDAEKLCVHEYMESNPTYVTFLLQIWATPCMQEDVLSRLVRPIQDSPMRGLEKHCLRSMKQRRGVVLKKVLQAQIDLYRYVPDPQERALLLKQECQPLSRTSARFARAMALGDAAEAAV